MDTLYYSNYCPHCSQLLEFMNKNGLLENVAFVNIDKRKQDNSGIWYAQQATGKMVMIPHIVHSVPALLKFQNHNLLMGEQIREYLQPFVQKQQEGQGNGNGEPLEYSTLQLGAREEGGSLLMASSTIGGSMYV